MLVCADAQQSTGLADRSSGPDTVRLVHRITQTITLGIISSTTNPECSGHTKINATLVIFFFISCG